jgi:acyl-CoA hydrolase
MNGVKLSKHGKTIVFLPSKSKHGRSNIVFALPQGTGISITRSVNTTTKLIHMKVSVLVSDVYDCNIFVANANSL